MKILIIKTSAIGDIIHAFHALSFIKKHLPQCSIDWVVEKPFASLVESHPLIQNVFHIQSKKWKANLFSKQTLNEIKTLKQDLQKEQYDYIFDLQGNIKSGLCLSLCKGKKKVGFSYSSAPEWPNCLFTNLRFSIESHKNIREDYLLLVQKALNLPISFSDFKPIELKIDQQERAVLEGILKQAPENAQKVGVALGSNWKNKKLPSETLIRFLKRHPGHRRPFYFLFFGNQQEKKEAEKFAAEFPDNSFLVEKLSLAALQNFMLGLDLVISMDSMPLHLAETAGVATLSFFGPSLASKYAPVGKQNTNIQGPCPYGRSFSKRCPILRSCKTGACIKNLQEKDIPKDILSR
ncbi:MAG: lipopolysaccharide heptosyltransferase I [Chlamydiales bacterium]|nr:lipopolysaccharide heptosyltransferase I [Chlamydiales bacterium]